MSDVILNMCLMFIERQVIKFGQEIDWVKVKADAKVRIEDVVPGTYFDATAVTIVNALIDLVANFFISGGVPVTLANLKAALTAAQAGLLRHLASRVA